MIFKKKSSDKIFCIGRNKTGTTSLEKALRDLGYKMGNVPKGERLLKDYEKSDFGPIVKFCKTAQAFQDAPFSWPYTWLVLFEHFPNAKFILTVRDEEEWYKSITSYHSKLFSGGKRVPTMKDLQNAKYRYKGFVWDASRAVWKTPEDDVYNKEMFIENYKRHNEDVLHFFKDKPNFISLNVSQKGSYLQLCEFLNKKPLYGDFPHLNKTKS